MSRSINSSVLGGLNRILGIAGVGNAGSAPETQLDDDNLTQVIGVLPIVRRSSLGANASGGWWYWVQQHVHAAAGGLASSLNFYNPVDGTNFNGWPSPVPRGMDVWVGAFCGRRTAGAGTLGGAVLIMNGTTPDQGMGIDDAGSGLQLINGMPVCEWDELSTAISTGPDSFRNSLTLQTMYQPMIRIPRGGTFGAGSEAVGAAATFIFQGIAGLFPEGLGQDLIGNAP